MTAEAPFFGRARRAGLWGACALAAMAFGAPIARADPLPVTAVTPSDGATILTSTAVAPFEIDTSGFPTTCTIMYLFVEISTQDVPGQDGSLANDYVVNDLSLTQSDATPTAYKGTFFPDELAPGTYYWQANASCFDTGGEFGFTRAYLSAVYTLVIASPPPPVPVATTPTTPPTAESAAAPKTKPAYRMTLTDVASDVPLVILRNDATARIAKRKCARLSLEVFGCSVAWRDKNFATAGILHVADNGNRVRSTFTGERARLSCLRRHPVKQCARSFQWS